MRIDLHPPRRPGRHDRHGTASSTVVLLLVVILHSSCTVSHTAVGTRHTVTLTALDESMFLNDADTLDSTFARSGRLVYHPELQSLFVNVSHRLLAARGTEESRVRVRVIRDPEINAFALPNGTIYFHTGLLSLLQNEDQFAAVLAHEVEHVLGRHSVRDFRVTGLQVILLTIGFSTLESMIGGSRHDNKSDSLELAVFFATRAYSRALEREADFSSIHTLERAGYDPGAMAAALERIAVADHTPAQRVLKWQTRHPEMKERIRYCLRECEGLGGAPRVSPNGMGEGSYHSLVEAALAGP